MIAGRADVAAHGRGSTAQSTEFHGIAVVVYCLMSNHVHVIAVPEKGDVLARALKETHGRFASYWNVLHHSTACLAGPVLFLPSG